MALHERTIAVSETLLEGRQSGGKRSGGRKRRRPSCWLNCTSSLVLVSVTAAAFTVIRLWCDSGLQVFVTAHDNNHAEWEEDQLGPNIESESLLTLNIPGLPDYQDGDEDGDDVFVVATVKGDIMGVSKSDGNVLWKHTRRHPGTSSSTSNRGDVNSIWSDEEWNRLLSPIVSTSTTTKSSSSDLHTKAVPSVDGRVYLTPPIQEGTNALSSQEETSSIRQLVNKSPFFDSRGRFYVGNRLSTAAAIDRDTGEILRLIKGESPNNNSNDSNDDSTNTKGTSLLPFLEGRNVVWIGRVDHFVTVYNARTGNVDVNFASSEILSLSDMIGTYVLPGQSPDAQTNDGNERKKQQHFHAQNEFYARAIMQQQLPYSHEPQYHGKSIDGAQSLILSTPGGKLAYLTSSSQVLQNGSSSVKSQKIEWVANAGMSFSSPVAFAVSAKTGTSVKVDIVPDAPMSSTSAAYLAEQFEKELDLLRKPVITSSYGAGGSDGRTIVGALQGSRQLFALPLGGGDIQPHGSARANLEAPGSLARMPSSSSGLSTIPKHKTLPPLKHHRDFTQSSNVASQTQHTNPTETANANLQKSLSAKKCTESSPSYPACLLGGRDSIAPLPRLKKEDYYYDEEETSAGRVKKDDFKNLNLELLIGGGNGYNGKFDLFMRILTSWIPPFLLLLAFVAFELGRRERLKTEFASFAAHMSNAHHDQRNTILDNGGIRHNSSTAEPPLLVTNGNGIRNGGSAPANSGTADHVIQVTDEILGYGGHGTVVYKGTLDGRRVAVKRMLKAYHASAEREISLLIESDGHPNVVRYFLKEVRNDFVYLALELCEMSLSDLIYAVGRTNNGNGALSTGNLSLPPFFASTKKMLYQIAAGVRHLHDLRIVHRDIKPQNILLALRNRREEAEFVGLDKRASDEDSWKRLVCAAFEKDKLLPKISDMGLGKQLLGQSSFGASTLGPTSNGTNGASIGLGGPGSVGWQAPEVMALRSTEPSFCSMDQASSESSPIGSLSTASRRSSRSVDVFSLGCVFHCSLLPGTHPFGEWYEREANIMRHKPDIAALQSFSAEAHDLVSNMIARDPKARPTATEVCNHPFFWKHTKRLAFLSELSDRLEASVESCITSNTALFAIEANAGKIVGLAWDRNLDRELLTNVSKFRTYDPSSVRDCLRMIRNKNHHFDELPDSLKDRIGHRIEDLIQYFDNKFPRLLMHCYKVCQEIMPPSDPFAIKFSIHTRATLLKSTLRAKPAPTITTTEEEKFNVESQPPLENTETARASLVEKESTITFSADDSFSGDIDKAELVNHIVDEVINEESLMSKEDFDTEEVSKSEADRTSETAVSEGSSTPTEEQPSTRQELLTISSDFSACDRCEDENDDIEPETSPLNETYIIPDDVIVWEGSTAAKLANCRGWYRSEDEWGRATDVVLKNKRDPTLVRCADDPKFRTRLCNHWDESMGTHCPMRKKNKCVFAHGPVELRVKEGKRHRWGTLVDEEGNNNNPFHSGGEDTYGAARSIENVRKEEGKWSTNKAKTSLKAKGKPKKKPKLAETPG